MKRCIIHIGMHKTGSTSIQISLHKFEDSEFCYAKLGPANHSLAIYSLFSPNPEKHHLHRANNRDTSAVNAYNQLMRKNLENSIELAEGRTLIISGEDIGVLQPAGLARMHKYFRDRFDEISIVGYVRPPADFISSGFQQRIKDGSLDSFDLEQQYRNFKSNFGKFDDIFGRENVQLWKFQPSSFPNNCVVRDFCTRLGINLPENRIVRVNESLTRLAVSLIYAYRKFGKSFGSESMRGPEATILGAFIKAVDNKKFRLSPDVVRPILEKNRSDIEWMENRLGTSLQDDLGAYEAGLVKDEADLLFIEPVTIRNLLKKLGPYAPVNADDGSPKSLAIIAHSIRKMNSEKEAANPSETKPVTDLKDTKINVVALLELIEQNNPELLAGLPKSKAATFLRTAFSQINDIIGEAEEGNVNFKGLGQFRIKFKERVSPGKDGKHTHITYRPSGIK